MVRLYGRSLSIFIVTVVFLGISFIAVCLRCLVRVKIVKAFGWDDGMMGLALVYHPVEYSLVTLTDKLIDFQHAFRIMWNNRLIVWHWPAPRSTNQGGYNRDCYVCM